MAVYQREIQRTPVFLMLHEFEVVHLIQLSRQFARCDHLVYLGGGCLLAGEIWFGMKIVNENASNREFRKL